MLIGVPKEIKNNEYRVGMIPAAVRELVSRGHNIFVETKAGDAIDLSDEIYARAGATILASADEIYAQADMIVKVKEPQPAEIKRLRPGQTLFTYLHLAPDPEQTKGLIESGGDQVHAERLLRTSIALKSDQWESHYELGVLLEQQRKYSDAAVELERSARINPGVADVHYHLSRVYDRLGEADKAAEQRGLHERLTASGGVK